MSILQSTVQRSIAQCSTGEEIPVHVQGALVNVARGGGGQPVQRDLTTMCILEEDAQLDFQGIPCAGVDHLPFAAVVLGVVLQKLHDLSSDGLIHTVWQANVQEDL